MAGDATTVKRRKGAGGAAGPVVPRRPGRAPGDGCLYTDAIADEILSRMTGGESLKSICRSPGMPSSSTVCGWVADVRHAAFADRYARARERQADVLFDELDEIARRCVDGEIEPQAARVLVDTTKWRLAKMRPRVYGDRLEIDATVTQRNQSLAEMMDAIDAKTITIQPDSVRMNQADDGKA